MKRQLKRTRNFLKSYRSFVEPLEDRYALDGTPWTTFGGNPQHTSVSSTTAQLLEAIHWSSPVDNFPTSRAAHYGGPLITANNTVIYPYKVGTESAPDFHIIARNGNTGAILWDESTDIIPVTDGWFPALQPVYVATSNRVYFPGANGNLYYKDNVDTPSGVSTKVLINVFGATGNLITTAMTADATGNIYYGYRNGSVGGFVKVTPAGVTTIVTANAIAQDASVTDWTPQTNHAPAISNDGQTIYVAIRRRSTAYYGRLIGLSTATMSTQYNSGILKDPRSGGANNAGLLNQSTASPMVAPDGHVYFGIFGNPYNGSRGWMAHFNADLTMLNTSTPDPTDVYVPGGFGWDATASIVPVSMVPQYTGPSQYLLFTKYNNYYLGGGPGADANGSNAIAVIDPNQSEVEYHADSGGQLVMKRILYKVGPTPDWDYPTIPTAVREWCINYGAVDVASQTVIVNCADGKFYKWHLPSDTLVEPITLTSGIGQPYTMTVIGVDGTVYGIQIGTIFAMGQTPRMSISDAVFSEGTGGSTIATFTVSLNYPRNQTITVNYATANGTATAGSDYTSTSGSLTFTGGTVGVPGQMSKTISVTISPDSLYELDETFSINLSGATNAVILDAAGQGTISNDDAQPTLSITDVSENEGNSGTTSFVFTVTQSAISGLTTTVNFATSNGTANGGDYTGDSGGLTFTPGQTSKTITILVNGDTTFEGGDTFFVTLSGNVNAGLLDSQGLGTIINDDNVPSLSIGDVSVTEGALATFFVTLSNASSQSVTVDFATANNTAVGGADFVAGNGTLTFAAGETSKSFSVTTINDTLDEVNPETYFVNLTNPGNAFISDNQAIGSLVDNDPAPSISIGNVSLNEGVSGTTAFNFVVTLSAASGRTVRVNYATAHDTTSSDDYQTTSGLLTFTPGETSKQVTVLVNGDSTNETNETFFVNLSNPIASSIADGQGLGTIVNDDGLSISIADLSLVEGDSGTTSFSFVISLSASSGTAVNVDFATADGTATTADGDYAGGSGTVTFAIGETSKFVTILVNGDVMNEADETFVVNLSNSVNAAINDGQATGTIENDDPLPSISIADFSVPEMDYNTGTVNVYVTLSAPSGQTVTVFYETANGTALSTSANKDYIDTFGTLTFDPGETVGSFEVSIVGDFRDEPNETIRVLLSSPVNATIADDLAIITILDDDLLYVQTVGPTVTEGNSGQTIATVTVNLTIPADYDITIDYDTVDLTALAGSDYVATSGTLTFLAGITSQTVDIQINGDLLDELDEKFDFELSNATPGAYYSAYRHTDVNITDDDIAGFVIDNVSLNEGNSGTVAFVFTVSLTNAADHTVGVNYATANGTAIANGDYQSTSGALSFAAGVTSQTVTVFVNGDITSEPNETFFVNLSAPTGGGTISDSQGLGTINNDDSTSFSINDITEAELNTGVHGYTFIATLSSPSTQVITVQYATADGTATTSNNDYFANSGTLTFNPGQTTKVITVQVKGDKRNEANEFFVVNLSNPTNASISDGQGVGTLLNDDGVVPEAIVAGSGLNTLSASDSYAISTPLSSDRSLALVDAFPGKRSSSNGNGSGLVEKTSPTEQATFSDLRYYVLNAGQLQPVATGVAADDNFAYSIESSVRHPRAKIRS